jgi:Holliday junction resolvase RusA-like endonuclease
MPRTIVLSGEPKSTQHIYRSTCRGGYSKVYMTDECKALKEQYQWEAKTQWRGEPFMGDLALTVRFFFASKRRRDLDNQNKLVLDSLTGIAYKDDSQIADLRLIRDYDKARPRVELTIQEFVAAVDGCVARSSPEVARLNSLSSDENGPARTAGPL